MVPLCIQAKLDGGIVLPYGSVAVDALLAAVVAKQLGLPPPSLDLGVDELIDIDVPIRREPHGQFCLASFSLQSWELHEPRHVNRQFPVPEARMLGVPALKKINVAAGAQKSYRIPHVVSHAVDDTISWFVVGDARAIEDLLVCVSHLGRRRGSGRGRVMDRHVSPCTPWGDGFPVVRDGRALRPLPPDWPGLCSNNRIEPARLHYPYWLNAGRKLCAVPEVA